ncbi:MAG: malonyl-ACP O-methyltransferase BioC [Candidatus Omnitrophica bacterium]|nr:malonyl-ACP O-methyltransferase BioC [Candidatus Omnitrophota bacterium]
MNNKEIIRRNFSRHAYSYDYYCGVQRKVAHKLLERINGKRACRILEIGCGTGNYTALLRRRYKEARLEAVDISEKMIEVAKKKLKKSGVRFSIGDAPALSNSNSFDLITSNACFQWLADLEGSLTKYKKLLKRKGAIAFTVFGPLTFHELNIALRDVCANSVAAERFMSLLKLKEILGKNFKKISIVEKKYRENYRSLTELLFKIKYSGIRGSVAQNNIIFTRKILRRLENTYGQRFGAIRATYQVFFCVGFKP